jgi:hypothetical protein
MCSRLGFKSKSNLTLSIAPFDLGQRVLGRDAGEGDGESGPGFRLAFEADLPAVGLDDPRSQIETQAGALSDLLGGEKRLENLVLQVAGDAAAVVSDFDGKEILPGIMVSLEEDLSLRREGISGVEQDIDQHPLQLIPIAVQWRKDLRQPGFNADLRAVSEFMLDELQGVLNQLNGLLFFPGLRGGVGVILQGADDL